MARPAGHIPSVRRRLLNWWSKHKRPMPWRAKSHAGDPYRVWVSEIMLQQTQVDTVKPYYRRFVRRFPTVSALAAAPVQDVLKCWEHLGYYARARNLHQAAKVVVRDFDGRLPDDLDALQRLPGIGRYTAAMIASIAFGQDEPTVDGNIARVLARIFRIRTDIKQPKTVKRLWRLAGELLSPGRAGDFNQALMDLGATVCTPASPQCRTCPLIPCCLAAEHNEQHTLPKTPAGKPVPHVEAAVGIISGPRASADGPVLVARRKDDALLGGLWEFPGGKIEPGETPAQAAGREVREETGLEVIVGPCVAVVRHTYSHFSVTIHAFRCTVRSGRPRAIGCAAIKWMRLSALSELPIPKASDKILTAMGVRRPR